MKILIACEFSGIVRDAFAARGFDAWSCDLLPTERPGRHIQGDVLKVLGEGWDAIIAFPPCTHLAASGAPSWKEKQADGRQKRSIEFVLKIWDADCRHIGIENPTGILNTVWRKPDQIIHPFYFGDPFMKRTCLWLKNLPPLYWAKNDTLFEEKTTVEPAFHFTSNSYRGGKRKDGTRKVSDLPVYRPWDTGKERSESFRGIANAMAIQWGDYLKNEIKLSKKSALQPG